MRNSPASSWLSLTRLSCIAGISRVLGVSLALLAGVSSALNAQSVVADVAYAEPVNPRQLLDVYAPPDAKNLPVVFWIHGGGWVVGDKTKVALKPKAFTEKGFVFVATNYRFLPAVDMETLTGDVARALRWVHANVAKHGGDPNRIFVMGHSAGAQLAALLCTDHGYLKREGLSPSILRGCVPVDGDTYDIPSIIETASARRKALGQPDPKFGHFEKFGGDPVKHRSFSAVNHVAKDKGIPPFLVLHVAAHADTSAQARRLGEVLAGAGVPVRVFGAADTDHGKIDTDLGTPGDPSTEALFEFVSAHKER